MRRVGPLGDKSRVCKGVFYGLALFLCFLCAPARAAFDHTGILADPLTALDTTRVFKTEFTIPDKSLEGPVLSADDIKRVLEDREARIASEFRIPDGLEQSVRFWLAIYTLYTTHHLVIFDSREEIIYDVLDLRSLYKSSRNLAAYEIVSRHRTERAMAAVRATLAYLARHPKLKNPTPEQARILKAVQDSGSRTPLSQLARHVRSQTGQRDSQFIRHSLEERDNSQSKDVLPAIA